VNIRGGAAVTEGTVASFTVTASPAPTSSLIVLRNVEDVAGSDFLTDEEEGDNSTWLFPRGQSSHTFTIPTVGDSVVEQSGDIRVTLRPRAGQFGYMVGSASSATVQVNDDDGTTPPPDPLPPEGPTVSFATATSRAAEGDGLWKVTVRISPAATSAVTLNYGVAGTATAGSDFTIGSADSVAVSAGAVSVSIPVAIVDDREDEPAETIILTLARGDGYGLSSPRVHTLTIEDNDEPGLDIREKEAWLIRFGRTVSHQVVDAVQQRFSAAASPSPGLQVTVAGEELTTTPLEENEGVLTKLLGFETVTSPQLVTASAFSFSPQAAAPAPAEQGEAPQLAIWGSGALSSFRGTEDTLSLEGDVSTALVGADWSTARWQAGVALFRSWGSGGYEYERENGNDADVTATLTGLFPYGRYGLTPRLGIWAVAGTAGVRSPSHPMAPRGSTSPPPTCAWAPWVSMACSSMGAMQG